MTFTPDHLRRALLAWYDANRRNLPWRESTDPYRVWVSEVMLQQTRVDAVIPYYNRWLATFPDLESLASAELQEVLKHWEGLGYYSRARNLHDAACLVRERYNGRLPDTYSTLRELPGIGEYTAGAIASISYNQTHPAVDGNVRRVLSRIFDMPAPDTRAVRQVAERVVDPQRPGDFNQSLMELGATVCVPRKPSCSACPIQTVCRALANGTVEQRPGRKTKKSIPHEQVNTLICINDGSVLLRQRPYDGLLGGLWEFPESQNPPRFARRIGDVTHVFSHKRITYGVYLCLAVPPTEIPGEWIAMADLAKYPLSTAQRKIEGLCRQVLLQSCP
jgi:A/G-specific adenine glycosylase